ncbi:MAG: phosphotransferase [Theionarchaea archaeon]|nr:MAG: hypothetical protein AYK19_03365 [Theionarchaea archaeon DG-70-1]MBU7029669.1 phosphotransferase [Theionarchaea archaeon]
MEADFDNVLNKAANRYGTTQDKISHVGGFDNIVYEFERDGEPFVLRFTHSSHRTAELIKGEVDFLNYLADNDASVSRAVPSENGELVEVITLKNSYYSVVAFEKAKGVPAGKIKITEQSSDFFQELGQVIGKLHVLAKEYNPPNDWERPQWHEDDFYYSEKYVPSQPVIVEKSKMLIDYLLSLPKDRNSYGLIHADVNLSNISVHNGKITLFDFDDSQYSWFAHDIAVALFFMIMDTGVQEKEPFAHSFLRNFMRGYYKENSLTLFWLEHMPVFLNLHVILCYNIINYDCDLNNLDNWCQRFMNKRTHALENDIPFVDIDLSWIKEG